METKPFCDKSWELGDSRKLAGRQLLGSGLVATRGNNREVIWAPWELAETGGAKTRGTTRDMGSRSVATTLEELHPSTFLHSDKKGLRKAPQGFNTLFKLKQRLLNACSRFSRDVVGSHSGPYRTDFSWRIGKSRRIPRDARLEHGVTRGTPWDPAGTPVISPGITRDPIGILAGSHGMPPWEPVEPRDHSPIRSHPKTQRRE